MHVFLELVERHFRQEVFVLAPFFLRTGMHKAEQNATRSRNGVGRAATTACDYDSTSVTGRRSPGSQ
jgi:hypothetical protein